MLTITIALLLAQTTEGLRLIGMTAGGSGPVVTITPTSPKPGERVKVEILKPEQVDIVGAKPDPRLTIARVQARFYAIQARRAAILERLAQDEAQIREEYERLVRALPGWRAGCDVDDKQELVCLKKEEQK